MTRGEFITIAIFIMFFAWLGLIQQNSIAELNNIFDVGKPEEVIVEHTTEAETQTQAETTAAQPCTDPASSFVCGISEHERDLLVRVAYLEARGQGVEGLALVMNVILNRSNISGLSIEEVIYSPGQFAVVDEIATCTPSADAYEALSLVLNGHDTSLGALYFCTPAANSWHASHLTYLFTYGGHEFYK